MSLTRRLKNLWVSLFGSGYQVPTEQGRTVEKDVAEYGDFLARVGEPEPVVIPREVLRINDQLSWLRTTIRRVDDGLETELRFETADGVLAIVIGCCPSPGFLIRLIHAYRIAIRDRTPEERGWVENTRFEIRINDDDEIEFESFAANQVRWSVLNGTDELPDSMPDDGEAPSKS